MPRITERQLVFDFPAGWTASKFDEWSFYRSQFMRLAAAERQCSKCNGVLQCPACGSRQVAGTKGIDILAIDPGAVCWNIEIKDYRKTRVTRFEFLADEVALKVRDTLACLAAARLNANDQDEKTQAVAALKCERFRVVLHLEQPAPKSPLNTKQTVRANLLQRLKQLIKPIDPHPLVVDHDQTGEVDWAVTQNGPVHQI